MITLTINGEHQEVVKGLSLQVTFDQLRSG